jgi:SAM-dependent methyltransferase
MKQEERDWYDTPLYYDIIYDADTRKEADLLEHVFRKFATAGKTRRVLEPACGSGRLVIEMARRGWSASGFDGSAKMLGFAKERLTKAGLKARLWEDWMQSFEVPAGASYDLAHCFINTFRYLLTEKDARAFFQRVTAALRPGGVFVLGLHLTDYDRESCEHERWVMDRKGVHVVCNTRTWPADRRTRIEKLRTRLVITHKGRTHRQETVWQYRTYDVAQLKRLLKAAAPELEVMECHDFTYDPKSPRGLDHEFADVVLALRKKS